LRKTGHGQETDHASDRLRGKYVRKQAAHLQNLLVSILLTPMAMSIPIFNFVLDAVEGSRMQLIMPR
jgi:hypothetical protein